MKRTFLLAISIATLFGGAANAQSFQWQDFQFLGIGAAAGGGNIRGEGGIISSFGAMVYADIYYMGAPYRLHAFYAQDARLLTPEDSDGDRYGAVDGVAGSFMMNVPFHETVQMDLSLGIAYLRDRTLVDSPPPVYGLLIGGAIDYKTGTFLGADVMVGPRVDYMFGAFGNPSGLINFSLESRLQFGDYDQ
jgi:hypothetical protein